MLVRCSFLCLLSWKGSLLRPKLICRTTLATTETKGQKSWKFFAESGHLRVLINLWPSLWKINNILQDTGNPLNSFVAKSSRSKRLVSIPTESNRDLNSLIPHRIKLYSSNSMRSHTRFSPSFLS